MAFVGISYIITAPSLAIYEFTWEWQRCLIYVLICQFIYEEKNWKSPGLNKDRGSFIYQKASDKRWHILFMNKYNADALSIGGMRTRTIPWVLQTQCTLTKMTCILTCDTVYNSRCVAEITKYIYCYNWGNKWIYENNIHCNGLGLLLVVVQFQSIEFKG